MTLSLAYLKNYIENILLCLPKTEYIVSCIQLCRGRWSLK